MNDINNKITSCFKMNIDINGIRELENYITGLEKGNQQLIEQNKLLKNEIKIHSKKSNGRYKAIKILEKHISKLNLECQRYFDCLMDVDKENNEQKRAINKAINKLSRYADEMRNNGNAYVICVDLLDILNKYKGVD